MSRMNREGRLARRNQKVEDQGTWLEVEFRAGRLSEAEYRRFIKEYYSNL